ncbi:MAG: NUDIX domain-containing protein [Sphingomonadaceae bacterium]
MSEAPQRRLRPAARIIVLGPGDKVLLFRYVTSTYPPFWILPGGEAEAGEDYPEAAARELAEETGIVTSLSHTGTILEADYEYRGEPVRSVEHFFWCRVQNLGVNTKGHTALEREVMQEYRWFEPAEFMGWGETIYPLDLTGIVRAVRQREGAHRSEK